MKHALSRREFLKRNLVLGGALAAGLDVISGPQQARAASLAGYKALVCVYLAGGNDSFNMFVPTSASAYADYADARQFLAIPRAQLRPVAPVAYSDGLTYGFHPSMSNATSLFGSGELAVIGNVGSLIQPINKEQFEARSSSIPAQLFSHNDQTDSWLAADARGRAVKGWAGRTMDIMYPGAIPLPSPSISIGGNSLWQTADRVRAFEIEASGVATVPLPDHSGPVKLSEAYQQAYQGATNDGNLFVQEHARIQSRGNAYGNLVNDALAAAPTFSTAFDDAPLAKQLQMVARLIAVRDQLDSGTERQVFFVRLGGWDTHSSQLDGEKSHANLLTQLDRALGSFQSAMAELGEQNSVTAFTATEFGRSLTPNGSGTDHGWGGHNLVLGGAVNGGDIYGTMPQVSRDSSDTVANNRIIPTTSVDQYSATLARWFGLNDTELGRVFPNLTNFVAPDLGFMA